MLAVQASLLHEVFLQKLYRKGGWPYFEFNKSFIPLSHWCIDVFSSAYLRHCRRVLRCSCTPKWNKHWFVRGFVVHVYLESINLYQMKMFIIVVEAVVMSFLSLNVSKICLFSYYLGNDTVYSKVSAEVQLGWGSQSAGWQMKWM